jgi:hypothetical protein
MELAGREIESSRVTASNKKYIPNETQQIQVGHHIYGAMLNYQYCGIIFKSVRLL